MAWDVADGDVGYVVYYSTDATRRYTDWLIEPVRGDRLSATIRDLRPDTTYYFKVAARNKAGYGPLSPTVIFHMPRGESVLIFHQYSTWIVVFGNADVRELEKYWALSETTQQVSSSLEMRLFSVRE